jgi:hypothetical protein
MVGYDLYTAAAQGTKLMGPTNGGPDLMKDTPDDFYS